MVNNMITLKEWMELVDYRITEGSEYLWSCYGHNAYCLDSWVDGGPSFSVIFDKADQTVYETTVCDYKHNRAYRMINPEYYSQHASESNQYKEYDGSQDWRNIRYVDLAMLEGSRSERNGNQAWDDVDYVDLDVLDDFIQKAQAIKAGEDYDTRVSVPIEIEDSTLLLLFKEAHARDITFNQLVEDALREQCKKHGIEIPE